MPEWFLIISIFMLGCIIGSFLNVCIVRIPSNMSIVFPSSHCPACGKSIPFYCNIPLLSYIFLGARCKFCSSPIPFRYFMVEILTPIVMLVLFFHFGLTAAFLISFIFSAALIVITFIDLKHQIIPDIISLPGIPLCLLSSFAVPWASPLQSLAGILVGGGILYAFAFGYRIIAKKDGMGGGDIKLLAMIGAFLGWKGALSTLILGALSGSIIGVVLILFKGRDLKYAVPFGPFLSAGAFCTLLFGEELIHFYLLLGR
jgi:leader peptidase (prepilin peptidase) / N-methyltransferase